MSTVWVCEVLVAYCMWCSLMQPDGSESDSMADYNISTQPDKADIQEKVQLVLSFKFTVLFMSIS